MKDGFELCNVGTEGGPNLKAHVYAEGDDPKAGPALAISFDGYGDCCRDGGPPVIIENRDGVPFLVVFSDINSEEPTHVISLAGASLKRAQPGEDKAHQPTGKGGQ